MSPTPSVAERSQSVLLLPAVLILLLGGLTRLSPISGNSTLVWSFWGAAGVLAAWLLILATRASRSGQKLEVGFAPKRAHWVQAVVQIGVYAYWGWYWPEVYAHGSTSSRRSYSHTRSTCCSRGRDAAGGSSASASGRSSSARICSCVPRRLVLPAVRDGGGGLPGQGTDSLAARRPARPHLQPLGALAQHVFGHPARHRRHRDHVGSRDRRHAARAPSTSISRSSCWAWSCRRSSTSRSPPPRRQRCCSGSASSSRLSPGSTSSATRRSRSRSFSGCTSSLPTRLRRHGPTWAE